jgi:multiple sugar transport system permease protein
MISRKEKFLVTLITIAPLLVFYIIPLIIMFMGSVKSGNSMLYEESHSGIDNYALALRDSTYPQATVASTVFTALSVILQTSLALGAALATRRTFKGVNFVRALLFAPYLLPTVVVVVAWRFFSDPFVGLVQVIFRFFGSSTLDFRGASTALPVMVVVSIYEAFPFVYIILLARMAQIPQSLYEVTFLAGAGKWNVFKAVTWPQIKLTLLGLIGLRFIITFLKFDVPWLVYASQSPSKWGDTLAVAIYRTAFENLQHGKAFAASVLFLSSSWAFYALFKLFVFKKSDGRSV